MAIDERPRQQLPVLGLDLNTSCISRSRPSTSGFPIWAGYILHVKQRDVPDDRQSQIQQPRHWMDCWVTSVNKRNSSGSQKHDMTRARGSYLLLLGTYEHHQLRVNRDALHGADCIQAADLGIRATWFSEFHTSQIFGIYDLGHNTGFVSMLTTVCKSSITVPIPASCTLVITD